MMNRSNNLVYTVRNGNKTIGFYHGSRPYVIGFRSPILARQVHYNLSPWPNIDFSQEEQPTNTFYRKGSIKILKMTDKGMNVHDGVGFHMNIESLEKFLNLPFKNGIGVIIPFEIEVETQEHIILQSHIVDPYYDAELRRRGLLEEK